jgi:hypothetical protein
MEYDLNKEDETGLRFMRTRLRLYRDMANEISDEYPPTSAEALAIGEVGSRLNPVLVALDKVLEPD